jgi:cysteine desulfuration protein SufE
MFTSDDLSSVSLPELIATNNWQSQYRLITQWGKLIIQKPELRKPEYLVKGCEVSAWLAHSEANGVHYFAFDSDSRVINGLAVLLLAQVQYKTNIEVSEVDFEQLLLSVGLEKHLTPSRNNGLHALILKIREFILAE